MGLGRAAPCNQRHARVVGRAIGRDVVNFESLVTPILRKRGCLAATAQVAAMVIPATGNPHGSFRWIDVTNLLFLATGA